MVATSATSQNWKAKKTRKKKRIEKNIYLELKCRTLFLDEKKQKPLKYI
jgi:hypothetical protein